MQDLILRLLGYASELLIFITGAVSMHLIYLKNRKYKANKLIGTAFLFVGLYGLLFLIYDVTADPGLIIFCFKSGLIFMTVGILLLYFGIKVLAHSEFWFEEHRGLFISGITTVAAYCLWVILSDFVHIISLEPVVNVRIDLPQMMVMIVIVYIALINAIRDIIKFGIKETSDSARRNKMKIFTRGLKLTLIAAVVSTLSQIPTLIESVLDIIYMLLLAISMIIMTYGLTTGGTESKKED